jgi:hypothetical protein
MLVQSFAMASFLPNFLHAKLHRVRDALMSEAEDRTEAIEQPGLRTRISGNGIVKRRARSNANRTTTPSHVHGEPSHLNGETSRSVPAVQPINRTTDNFDPFNGSFEIDADLAEAYMLGVSWVDVPYPRPTLAESNATAWSRRMTFVQKNWSNARPSLAALVVAAEAPPIIDKCCSSCKNRSALVRCRTCVGCDDEGFQYLCRPCDQAAHPFAHIHQREVWGDGYFQPIPPHMEVTEQGDTEFVGKSSC